MLNNLFMSRFESTPVLLAPDMLGRFTACINALEMSEDAGKLAAARMAEGDGFWPEPGSWLNAYRPYVVVDGILQIPVKGVLLHDWPYAMGDWATGYIYIARAFERGMSDSAVKGIALICDSPGGEVAGNFDLVDKMFAARGQKPIRAFAHEAAYSAAYSIASVADHIAVSRTGGVGSIGVVTGHLDRSKQMDMMGLKYTFIFAGKHKVDGNSYEPLPADVKSRIQSRIDETYGVFVSTVARNRGLSEKAVRATEAATYTATEALSEGLADSIGSLDDAVAAFSADLCENEGDTSMPEQAQTAVADQAAEMETVRTTAHAAGVAEGAAIGAKAERDRIVAIIGSEAAKERPTAALSAALKTDMTVDQATAFLADLAVETTAPAPKAEGNAFIDRMNSDDHPNVGAGASGEAGGGTADPKDGSSTVALARSFGLSGLVDRT